MSLYENDKIAEMTFPDITPTPTVAEQGHLGFIHGFLASLSMIVVSEIGDKTFFIAAIMSMKHSRLTVFAGAISALALMTVLSVVFGWAATIIPRAYTYYISTALFAIFGIKMLREGCKMSPNEGQEEFEEVQSDLRKRDEEFEEAEKRKAPEVSDNPSPDSDDKFEKEVLSSDVETGTTTRKQSNVFFVVSRIILQAFTLTFLAEWGDRSQLATIILAARENVYGVTLGGILGHSLCTGLAVIGGRFIAQRISVRTVMMIGGVVFLIFAFSALIVDPTWGS
ncbi:putative divalent cation/proton antiporter TMEM165 isoform X3 [Halyomorpha halys]|uniref:putative divalent cation/proton antiporter TMEM165 isoform X3 n=1 Tax=Halyomorpha halys TaxID=286706 RepID=UPI0006D4F8AB